jgi:hypothetical protein
MPTKPVPVPPPILLTIALLAVYTGVALWDAVAVKRWWLIAVAVLAACGCIGAARLRPWSQFVVYLLTAALIGVIGHSLYAAHAAAGLFHVAPEPQQLRKLAPAMALLALSLFSSYAVWRQFRQ